jgi:hypothetical protein
MNQYTQFIVTRNGELDQDYYKAAERAYRKQAIKRAWKRALRILGHVLLATVKLLGLLLCEIYARAYDMTNGTKTLQEFREWRKNRLANPTA